MTFAIAEASKELSTYLDIPIPDGESSAEFRLSYARTLRIGELKESLLHLAEEGSLRVRSPDGGYLLASAKVSESSHVDLHEAQTALETLKYKFVETHQPGRGTPSPITDSGTFKGPMNLYYSIADLASVLKESIYRISDALAACGATPKYKGKNADLSRWTGGITTTGKDQIFVNAGYFPLPDPAEVIISADALPLSWQRRIGEVEAASQSDVACPSQIPPSALSVKLEREEIRKRSALITDVEGFWPSIKRDLQDASRNGLSYSAKHANTFWRVKPALEWAVQRGKIQKVKANSFIAANEESSLSPMLRHLLNIG